MAASGDAQAKKPFRAALPMMALALLVAIVLGGAEVTDDGIRRVYNARELNHLKLASACRASLEAGHFPPSQIETPGELPLNPYLQFASPGPCLAMGLASTVVANNSLGASVTLVLLTAAAFFFAQRLGKYLSRSGPLALLGAFFYATAPYLAAARAISGELPLYAGMAFAPLALHAALRAVARPRAAQVALAAVALAWLALCHLGLAVDLTALFGLYLAAGLFCAVPGARDRRRRLRRKLFRVGVALFLAALSFNLLAFYALPLLGAGETLWRVLPPSYWGDGGPWGFLNLLSQGGLAPDAPRGNALRMGVLSYVSFLGFFWWSARAGALRKAAPLLIACFPLALAGAGLRVLPAGAGPWGLAPLSLAGLPLTLALGRAVARRFKLSLGGEGIAAFFLSALSLYLCLPYIYDRNPPPYYPLLVSEADLDKIPWEDDLQYLFYRTAPPGYRASAPEALFLLRGEEGAEKGSLVFRGDLARVAGAPGWRGELILDYLSNPRFQELTLTIDGESARVETRDFWLPLDLESPRPEIAALMGPRLLVGSLPSSGLLEARVRWVGSKLGSWLSLGTATALAFLVARAEFARRRSRGKGPPRE
ncbi:MAG: hypothetical protein LBO66_01795 [Deltaproteobacteria bacterium]|jgi:hypothetical protein|nr:hypothetical protein [Deltaproteobacteria bacterium]